MNFVAVLLPVNYHLGALSSYGDSPEGRGTVVPTGITNYSGTTGQEDRPEENKRGF
jgi:hypothetical protein